MRRTLSSLGVTVFALVAIGLVLLASAGETYGLRLYKNPNFFITRQMLWLGIASVALVAVAFFDYHRWREKPFLIVAAYIVVLALMFAVLFTAKVKGSHRWLALGPMRLQPSELAKLMSVLATAVFLDRAGWRIEKFWKGAVPAVAILGVLMALALAEPDFGATMVIALTGGVLLLVAGVRLRHLALLGTIGAGAVGTLLAFNKNRMNRIIAWLPGAIAEKFGVSPEQIAANAEKAANYQRDMAIVAIQNGGVKGVGFMQSRQKYYYLPEAHTDFIFAIGAEEWGLIFSLVLLALFVAFFVCGMMISARAPDRLGQLVAFGMTFLVFFQALFNIGVVSGSLPTKGIALPFISYGGTNLLTAMIAVGVLFNVGRQAEPQRPRVRRRAAVVDTGRLNVA